MRQVLERLAICALLVACGCSGPGSSALAPSQPSDAPGVALGVLERCGYCRESELNLLWTIYARPTDDTLLYVILIGRKLEATGAFSGVYAELVDETGGRTVVTVSVPSRAFVVSPRGIQLGAQQLVRPEGGDPDELELVIDAASPAHDFHVRASLRAPPATLAPLTLVQAPADGVYLEYLVERPRAMIDGVLEVDGRLLPLLGLAWQDSLRWQEAPLPEPLTWSWGFAQASALTAMFFHSSHPDAVDVVYLERMGARPELLTGRLWPEETGARSRGPLSLASVTGEGRLEWLVDSQRQLAATSVTYLAPFALTFTAAGGIDRASGMMVVEDGIWTNTY